MVHWNPRTNRNSKNATPILTIDGIIIIEHTSLNSVLHVNDANVNGVNRNKKKRKKIIPVLESYQI